MGMPRQILSASLLLVTIFCLTTRAEDPSNDSFLLGTKDLDYVFQLDSNWSAKTYELRDLQETPLEEGVAFTQQRDDGSKMILQLSYLQKDNFLDQSILAKAYWIYNRPFMGVSLESRYALGFMNFPSMFPYWTDGQASPANTPATYMSQIISSSYRGIDWYTGLHINLTSDYLYNHSATWGYEMTAFSHIDGVWGLAYRKKLLFGPALSFSYTGLVRTADYLPMDWFQDQELGVGFEHPNFSLKYFYPLKFEYQRQDYPFQDKRFEGELHLPFILNTRLDLNIISQYQDLYRAMISRQNGNINYGIYAGKNYEEKQAGFQVSLAQDIFKALDDLYLSKEYIQPRPVTWGYSPSPPVSLTNNDVNVPTLDQLAKVLTTPEKADWYTYNYINYTSAHNYPWTGWSDFYSAQQVFDLKKGNCVEQADFQKYLLDKNGYETAILGTIGRDFWHSVLAYKDPHTGGWDAIDNSGSENMYYVQADNYEDLITSIFPGWMSIVVKGDDGKGVYQIDSTSKWYVQDWFEKE